MCETVEVGKCIGQGMLHTGTASRDLAPSSCEHTKDYSMKPKDGRSNQGACRRTMRKKLNDFSDVCNRLNKSLEF